MLWLEVSDMLAAPFGPPTGLPGTGVWMPVLIGVTMLAASLLLAIVARLVTRKPEKADVLPTVKPDLGKAA